MDVNGDLWKMIISSDRPAFHKVASVGETRYWSNVAQQFADGTVMINGGSGEYNELVNVTRKVAFWNPDTYKVTFGASEHTPRLYHSASIMLTDGRVLSLGGGAPGPLTNLNGEKFSPPYLYDPDGSGASRPKILTAPTSIRKGLTSALPSTSPTRSTD